jgi:hypothetical protein
MARKPVVTPTRTPCRLPLSCDASLCTTRKWQLFAIGGEGRLGVKPGK